MSTHASINVKMKNGKVRSIYLHSDGYTAHAGAVLLKHYNTAKKAEALVKLGNLSSLAPKITAPKGHSYKNRIPGHVVAYHRDRGEALVFGEGDTFREAMADGWDSQSYDYCWNGSEWMIDNDTLKSAII